MKRMLFNATHSEELRVAVVDGQNLIDLDIDFINNDSKKGNIYKGKVTKIEPGLEAVFVDYGSSRQGFLSIKGVSRRYFSNYSASTPMAQVKIQDVLNVGDTLIVQVEKEERGNKGAALTTFISLAGRFLVLLPHNPRGGGISRQIEGGDRYELREIVKQIEIPEEHSIIARTAGIGQTSENFQSDLKYLLNLWKAIEKAADEQEEPCLLFQESSLIVRALRDYMREDITQILVDDKEIWENTRKFVKDVMPNSNVTVRHYSDNIPLFSRFQVEHQIEGAFQRRVDLPNGGSIIFDQTEALATIDVNSARSTKGADIEETAFETNIEAVEQIAKQLRVRDVGGLIVIDLIDMSSMKNKRSVEKQLVDALRHDRARVQVGKISRFGLLEMSRQRLRSSIEDASHHSCPRCKGRGFIRSVPSAALSILRILEEDALKENTELIHAHLPIEISTFLLNEKRYEINHIEKQLGTRIIIIPNPSILSPDYQIVRLGADDLAEKEGQFSYSLSYDDKPKEKFTFLTGKNVERRPAVTIDETLVSLPPVKEINDSFGTKLKRIFFGEKESDIQVEKPQKASAAGGNRNKSQRQRRPQSSRASSTSNRRGNQRPHSTRHASNKRSETKPQDSRPTRKYSSSSKSSGPRHTQSASGNRPRRMPQNREVSGNRNPVEKRQQPRVSK